jgi:hypothetical protein
MFIIYIINLYIQIACYHLPSIQLVFLQIWLSAGDEGKHVTEGKAVNEAGVSEKESVPQKSRDSAVGIETDYGQDN